MVLFLLLIKAELEGVESVEFDPSANICFDIQNPVSDCETREKVVIDPTQFVEQEEGAREPPHHFSIKWDGSKKTSVMTVLTGSQLKAALKQKKGKKKNENLVRALTAEDDNQFVPVLAFECRGLEPYKFHPMGGEFIVKSEGGKIFDGEDVDLSEDDWADYDDENDIAVSLSAFESKFESV